MSETNNHPDCGAGPQRATSTRNLPSGDFTGCSPVRSAITPSPAKRAFTMSRVVILPSRDIPFRRPAACASRITALCASRWFASAGSQLIGCSGRPVSGLTTSPSRAAPPITHQVGRPAVISFSAASRPRRPAQPWHPTAPAARTQRRRWLRDTSCRLPIATQFLDWTQIGGRSSSPLGRAVSELCSARPRPTSSEVAAQPPTSGSSSGEPSLRQPRSTRERSRRGSATVMALHLGASESAGCRPIASIVAASGSSR